MNKVAIERVKDRIYLRSAYDPRVVDAFLGIVARSGPEGPISEALRAVKPVWLAPREPVEAERPRPSAGASRDPGEILLLCALAEGLSGRAPLGDVAEALGRHLRRLVPAPLVVFYLCDAATGDLTARHVSGVDGAALDGLHIPLGSGLSGWVAAHRATIVNADPALDLGDRLTALSPCPASALSTPLLLGADLVGAGK